ncbi:MAG TPA: hypothetical protein VL307_15095 [Chitinophagaceae bacterium]|nr:hypothetical protein [Chitinophagaceae bacterium]
MLYAQLGYYITARVEQWLWQEAMQQKAMAHLPDSCLVAIPLSGNEQAIQWEEEGREFSLHGKRYDVVRSRLVNNVTTYFCFDDEKEAELLSSMNRITKDSHPPAGHQPIPALKLLYNDIDIEKPAYTPLPALRVTVSAFVEAALPEPFFTISVPPPRLMPLA